MPHLRLLLLICMLVPTKAAADSAGVGRRFGSCTEDGFFCFGPTTNITLLSIGLTTGTINPTFNPGAGYGLTFWADKAYCLGLSGFLAVDVRSNEPVKLNTGLIVSFAEYLRLGLAWDLVGATNTQKFSASPQLVFGLGFDIGRTPTSQVTSGKVSGTPKTEPAKNGDW